MVSFDLTPNSEIGNGQDNNDTATFLQTVGHQQCVTLEDFMTCLATFQALSVREYYLYRKAIARKAEDLPLGHQCMQYKCRIRGCPATFSMKVVNGKLIPQGYELVHTPPRSNAAVADFSCEFARLVTSRQFFSFKQLRQAITQFEEVS